MMKMMKNLRKNDFLEKFLNNSMKKNIFAIFIIFAVLFPQNIFANTAPVCPTFANIKLTADEVVSKVDSCIAARNA